MLVITPRRSRFVDVPWAPSTSTDCDASFHCRVPSGTASRPSTASRSARAALSRSASPSSDTRRRKKSDCCPNRLDWRWRRLATGSRTDDREIARYHGNSSPDDATPRYQATNRQCMRLIIYIIQHDETKQRLHVDCCVCTVIHCTHHHNSRKAASFKAFYILYWIYLTYV